MRVACFLLAVGLWSGAGGQGPTGSAPGGRKREGVPHFRGPRPPRDSGGEDESWINKIFSFVTPNNSEDVSGQRTEEVLRSSDATAFKAETYQPGRFANEFTESDRRYAGRPVPVAAGRGKHRYGEHTRPAVESNIGSDISRLIGGILPNSYYSRPKYRYPYYDKSGKGYLLYGYGGKDLYEYSIFKPLEGYF